VNQTETPTCAFYGGPWDGFEGTFHSLYTEMRIPVSHNEVDWRPKDEAELMNLAPPYHRYTRMSIITVGRMAFAHYHYVGVVTPNG
jgi:hypothetical protein